MNERKTSERSAAFTSGDDIRINKRDNKINSNLSDANNLMSVLDHEKNHKKNNQNPDFESNFYNHIQVYVDQMNEPAFSKATSDFQTGIINSFSNYIMNAAANSYVGVEKFADDFNKSNKLGFKVYVDTSPPNPSDYSTTIYRNNKLLGTVQCEKITNED